MPLTRNQIKLEEVEGAILSRIRAFREVPDDVIANQLAHYVLGLIDAMLRGSQHEIRRDEDGALNELVACHPRFVHLEQMDARNWWLALSTSDGHEISVDFSAKRAPIYATLVETTGDSRHSCCLCSKPEKPS